VIDFKGQGDETRRWGPLYVEDQSAYFLSINRNKQSIAIDMGRQQGQTIIREVNLFKEYKKKLLLLFY
jgi:crotonobetainyl-CoA:carnitine CoA-transferase CaiB-like acyl-CoA transferase